MAIAANFPSIKPSLSLDFANVGRLDPRITFARASTARYYDGVTTAKAEENLLLQSQNFTTTWANQNSTDTADTTVAPDGTTTADTITDDATNAAHYVSQNSSSISINTTYTFSCWLKAGTSNYAYLAIIDGANSQRYFTADFDLSTGTVRTSGGGTSGTLTSSSITEFPAGSGWYRCVIVGEVAAVSANTRALIGVSDGTTAIGAFGTIPYVGTGSTIIAWGAQLEQRSAVTAYTATTTQPITNYVPVLLTAQNNEARFDHNPTTGAALGLLIEEQRTNLFTYSDDFANAAWTKDDSSITANTIVAPDGTLTGDKLVENTANARHATRQSYTKAASAIQYTVSVYAKSAENRNLIIVASGGSFNDRCEAGFTLTAGTKSNTNNIGNFTNSSSEIVAVGNGWYRCSLTFTTDSTTSLVSRFVVSDQNPVTNASTQAYTGDGYSGIFIWGAQLEAGAFATSYIPTTTTALTRSADLASMTGTNFSSWYSAGEGSLLAQYTRLANATSSVSGGFPRVFEISDGTISNNIRVQGSPTALELFGVSASGTDQCSISFNAVAVGSVSKLIGAYKQNDFAATYNGSAASTDTSGNVPTSLTTAYIGNRSDGNRALNGYIQRIAYYPVRLTDAQLQALTG